MTYFVVPKGHSIIKSLYRTEDFYKAQKKADALREETNTHYDVIRMESAYTTQQLWELMEQDQKELGQ
jgi:hypothetical protein